MPALPKEKAPTRDQILQRIKTIHGSISTRMIAAGINEKTIKRDVSRVRLDVRKTNRTRNS